jgi:hypothetical protein
VPEEFLNDDFLQPIQAFQKQVFLLNQELKLL